MLSDPNHDASAAAPSPVLGVRGLELFRGGRRVCSGLTLTLGVGERLEITGANGAGKTSLLRVLAGLSDADGGDVLWRGRPRSAVHREYLQEMTYVAHKTGFKPELSARANLRFYAGLKSAASGVAVDEDEIDKALGHFGLAGAAVPCSALSEGQRRRAALARLPVERATVWLLDEPVATLDRAGAATLETLLAGHAAQGGVAVIATHQPLAATGKVHRLELPTGRVFAAP